MKTKICPCCDQPITGIYCKGCRKFVLHPVEQDVRYYLNTRHPESDHDCTYHDDVPKMRSASGQVRSSTHTMTSWETEAKKAEIKERMLQHKRSALIAAITTVLVTFVIIFTFVMIQVINTMDHVTRFGMVEAIPEPLATVPAVAMEEWELTDAQVKEAGVPCNGYGHSPVVFEDVSAVFSDCILDAGYGWTTYDAFSYNQFIDEYTWYETMYEYTIHNEDETTGYINVNVDTVTGEIHAIEVYSRSEDDFYEVTDIALKFIDKIGMASNLPAGIEFYEEAMKAQKEEVFSFQYGLEVVAYRPEPGEEYVQYHMAIYAPGYYTTVE